MKVFLLLLILAFAGSQAMDTVCSLRLESGPCKKLMFKWGYDTGLKECRKFGYGGCDGNKNMFETEEECQSACH